MGKQIFLRGLAAVFLGAVSVQAQPPSPPPRAAESAGTQRPEAPQTLEQRVADLEAQVASLETRFGLRDAAGSLASDANLATRLGALERSVDGLARELRRIEQQVDNAAREASQARREAMSAQQAAREAAMRAR